MGTWLTRMLARTAVMMLALTGICGYGNASPFDRVGLADTLSINSGASLPPFVLVCADGRAAAPEVTEDMMWTHAAEVRFRANTTSPLEGHGGFDDLLRVARALSSEGYTPRRLVVARGSASPTGPADRNEWLSEQRARVVIDSLRRVMPLDESQIERMAVGEDWGGLRRLVAESRCEWREEILAVIDANAASSHSLLTKSELVTMRGGRVWRMLVRDFFPRLISARVMLVMWRPGERGRAGLVEHPRRFPPVEVVRHIDTALVREHAVRVARVLRGRDSLLQVAIDSAAAVLAEPLPRGERRAALNVKANLLYTLALTPTVGVELLPRRGRVTVAAEWSGARWRSDSRGLAWVADALTLETRLYLGGGGRRTRHTGHYLSVYGMAASYDFRPGRGRAFINLDFGSTWGAGAGWGYVGRLGRSGRWRWEASVSVGYLRAPWDGYHDAEEWAGGGPHYYDYHGLPRDFEPHRRKLHWMGPTRAAVSLTYDLPWPSWGSGK